MNEEQEIRLRVDSVENGIVACFVGPDGLPGKTFISDTPSAMHQIVMKELSLRLLDRLVEIGAVSR